MEEENKKNNIPEEIEKTLKMIDSLIDDEEEDVNG